jgi:hypothetical protein
MGSYVSSRLDGTPAESTVWAAAVTSLKMEQEGPVMRSADDVAELIDRRYRPVESH